MENFLVTTALTSATVFIIFMTKLAIPGIKYLNAESLLARGKYDKAEEAFTKLSDFKDSQTRINDVKYARAESFLAAEDFDNAIIAFSGIYSYSDSAERVTEAKTEKAKYLENNGERDKAIELYRELDMLDDVNRVYYSTADDMFSEGKYAEAEKLFGWLGDYSDSRERAYDTEYIIADTKLSEKQFDDAISLFEDLASSDYKDSADRVLAARYAKAEDMLENKSYDGAMYLFNGLSDKNYKDSSERVVQIYEIEYSEADNLYKTKKYKEATNAFKHIGEYKDSSERATECEYSYAEVLYKDGDYNNAIIAFKNLGDHKKSKDYINECVLKLYWQPLYDYYKNGKTVTLRNDSSGIQTLYIKTLSDGSGLEITYTENYGLFLDDYTILDSSFTSKCVLYGKSSNIKITCIYKDKSLTNNANVTAVTSFDYNNIGITKMLDWDTEYEWSESNNPNTYLDFNWKYDHGACSLFKNLKDELKDNGQGITIEELMSSYDMYV